MRPHWPLTMKSWWPVDRMQIGRADVVDCRSFCDRFSVRIVRLLFVGKSIGRVITHKIRPKDCALSFHDNEQMWQRQTIERAEFGECKWMSVQRSHSHEGNVEKKSGKRPSNARRRLSTSTRSTRGKRERTKEEIKKRRKEGMWASRMIGQSIDCCALKWINVKDAGRSEDARETKRCTYAAEAESSSRCWTAARIVPCSRFRIRWTRARPDKGLPPSPFDSRTWRTCRIVPCPRRSRRASLHTVRALLCITNRHEAMQPKADEEQENKAKQTLCKTESTINRCAGNHCDHHHHLHSYSHHYRHHQHEYTANQFASLRFIVNRPDNTDLTKILKWRLIIGRS